jgi:hypothetical protein
MLVSTIVEDLEQNSQMKFLSTCDISEVNMWYGPLNDSVVGPFFVAENTIKGSIYFGMFK